MLYEIQSAESRSFRTNQRAAEFQSFSGKGAGKLACQLFIHAEHVAHFPSAYADVACRHIHVRSQMPPELQHESLAEAHDFRIALAAW